MKYATLALIATASASTAWKMIPMHTCTAAELTTAKTNLANYKKSWTKEQQKNPALTISDAWDNSTAG